MKAFFLCLAVLASTPVGIAVPADLVIRNANVIMVDANRPRASAFAIKDGSFLIVGSEETVQPHIGPSTRIIDVAGKAVVPGFIDAHAHPGPEYPEDSAWASVDCRPEKVRTMDALVAALKRKAERTPAGEWVTGSR